MSSPGEATGFLVEGYNVVAEDLDQVFLMPPSITDLTVHTAGDLADVQAELNGRLRKVLGWDTPAARMGTRIAPPLLRHWLEPAPSWASGAERLKRLPKPR